MHLKADTNEVFYVGKGNARRAYAKTNRSQEWHEVVLKHGYKVIIVDDNLSNQQACNLEKLWIKEIGRADLKTGKLINKTSGGQGVKEISDQAKLKQSEQVKKRFENKEYKEQWLKKVKEGQKNSVAWKDNFSKMNTVHKTGKILSESHKKKIQESTLKSLHQDDVRKKMIEANRRINSTPEIVEKNRQAQIMRHKAAAFYGLKHTQITREMRIDFQNKFYPT